MQKAAGVFAVLCAFLVFTHPGYPQQPEKVPVIGVLLASSESIQGIYVDRLRQSLKQANLVDGRNIVLEYRFANGKPSLGREKAAELVQRHVDVIVAVGLAAALSAAEASKTIPIVVAFAGDLLGSGLIDSLARPGGNVTGLSSLAQRLAAKRLEQVIEAIPGVSRVALMVNPIGPAAVATVAETKSAAEKYGISLQEVHVRGPSDFPDAFAAMARERAGALIMVVDPVISIHRRQLIALAGAQKLPTMCWRPGMTRDGCLMSYGADRGHMMERAAQYVTKILRGAKPADLPVERPTKLELSFNLRTARVLGIAIPPAVLVRADEVIE